MTPVLIVIIASYIVFCVQGQSPCTTPTNSTGKCISITQCSQLLTIASSPHRTNEQLTLLKESRCGMDDANLPMVCCAKETGAHRCFSPYGPEGTCVDVQSCPVLANLLKPPVSKHTMNYMKNYRCDETDQNRVCCVNCHRISGPPHPQTGCCGVERSGGKPDPDRIVTKIDQFPWMALIEYEALEDKNISYAKCGGVLISSRFVLSAAQCIPRVPWHFISKNVRLGEYDTTTEGPDCVEVEDGRQECTDGSISVPIEAVYRHPRYRPLVTNYDLALIKLSYEVPYTDFIRPICLPTNDVDQREFYTFYAAGWGAVSEEVWSSNKKLQVDLPFVPLEECKTKQPTSRRLPHYEGLICAGGVKGKGTCVGDSGNPLMSYNGFYEVVGVVSFGKDCGVEGFPDIFTYVYNYLPWIRSVIEP